MFAETVITENTSVNIGFLVGCVGFLVGAIWWAATMQAKVNMLLQFATGTHKDVRDLRVDFESLRHRVTRIEDHNGLKVGLILVALLLLPGCGRKKPVPAGPTKVSQYASKPLPVPPPEPDPLPTTQDIKSAQNDGDAALANVDKVLTVAKKTPAAEPVVPILEETKTRLQSQQQTLVKGINDQAVIAKQIDDMQKHMTDVEAAMKADNDRLKAAADADAAAANKQATAMQKENDDLRNEFMHERKSLLFWIGMTLWLGCGICGAAAYYGFLAGVRLAIGFGALGSVLIVASFLLEKIVFFMEMGVGAAVVLLLLYAAWHFFHHDPILVPGGKLDAA